MNNHIPTHEVILSGIHLDLTPALKSYVQEKVDRLFRHESHIVRVRVELEFDDRSVEKKNFIAKGHIQIAGPDINISVASDDAYKSIDLLVDKLDRKLRRRSRLRKVKRNHPHEIELDAMLPKVMPA